MIRLCVNCAFYSAGGRQLDGTCRFEPPTQLSTTGETEYVGEDGIAIQVSTELVYIGWPDVRREDWCGQFAPREPDELRVAE